MHGRIVRFPIREMWPEVIWIGSWGDCQLRSPKRISVLPSPVAFESTTNSALGKIVHRIIEKHKELTPIHASNLRTRLVDSEEPLLARHSCSLTKLSFARLSLASSRSCFCFLASKTIPNTPLRIAPIAVEPPPVRNMTSISPISLGPSVTQFL